MSDPVEGEVVNLTTPREFTETKHDETIVRLLEAAFKWGYNISEACLYAEISRETYYNWLGDDDIFSYRMSIAQSKVLTKAKQNVAAAISAGDAGISLRVLQLRDPDYKPKVVAETPEGAQRTEDKLKEFMNDTDDRAYTDPANDVGTESVAPTEPASTDEVAPGPTDIS
jgi:hypothetical protein